MYLQELTPQTLLTAVTAIDRKMAPDELHANNLGISELELKEKNFSQIRVLCYNVHV